MASWPKLLSALFVPAGVLVLACLLLLHSSFLPASFEPLFRFFPYLVYVAVAVLAWRFHSTRSLVAVVVLAAAQWGLTANPVHKEASPEAAVLVLMALLLPVDLLALSLLRENRLFTQVTGYWLGVIAAQAAVVALICQPETYGFGLQVAAVLPGSVGPLPTLAVLLFSAAAVTLVVRFVRRRDPVDNGFLWCIVASAFALEARGHSGPYFGAAALALAVALVESSYRMAYFDQLTALPGRRAFQDATLSLPERYALAIVDIDHFKKFNDVFGHEIGDEVLRMVASRLADVSGGGEAFRWGGEEFVVLFRDQDVQQAHEHLEELRRAIEESTFVIRRGGDRRTERRGRDRREGRTTRPSARLAGKEVFVTVSMGAAEVCARNDCLDRVLRAADRALYQAKDEGRNRVVIDRPAKKKARESIPLVVN